VKTLEGTEEFTPIIFQLLVTQTSFNS